MSDAEIPPLRIADVQRSVSAELDRIAPVLDPLGALFADAGHELSLVGGPVRDAMLGRAHNDLDFATSARPDDTERLLPGTVPRPPLAPPLAPLLAQPWRPGCRTRATRPPPGQAAASSVGAPCDGSPDEASRRAAH